MSEDLSREDVHKAVDELVAELLAEAGVTEPPVDAVALARHLGLEPGGARRGKPRREILALAEPTEEQRQRDAAAELAEHLKGDLLARLGIDPDGPRPLLGQSLSRLFVEHLLVPAVWLADEARTCGGDLFELKERFATAGHELIAFRLLDLGQPSVVTVVDNERVTQRRSNAFAVGRELAPAEKACLRQVQRYSRPCGVCEDGWDVRGWPLHRADWKREVLRAVVEE